jgi:hypothetical protein
MTIDPASAVSRAISRRRLLELAGRGYLGLNLGGLLRAAAAQAETGGDLLTGSKIRACILVFYYGGPSHIDTFDMKPDAPAEVRGEFKAIATSVPGLRICEHLPRMSRLMHKVALVRSMHHNNRLHDSASIETLTGRPSPTGDREEFSNVPQFFPCHGSTLSYLRQNHETDVPHVALPFMFHNVVNVPCQGGGYLGAAYDPIRIEVEPDQRSFRLGALNAVEGLGTERIRQRTELLAELQAGRDPLGTRAAVRQMRRFYDKALQLLNSEPLHRALDLSGENAALRERYGFGPVPSKVREAGGAGVGAELGFARQMRGQSLLLARRLVEAGVPFVNVYDFRQQGANWDAHANCASQLKNFLLPLADQSLSALIEDLDARGLLDTTLVVALGEFGRTPRINQNAGRDHWPDCYTVLLAGGGVKGGYLHGASDRIGAYPSLHPVTPGDLAATIFWRFGIDPSTKTYDLAGRPFAIADGHAIRTLFADEA